MISLNVNDPVRCLIDYTLYFAIVLKTNSKSVKLLIDLPSSLPYEKNMPYDKVAHIDENICVVWETWKGRNGRGGYRLERKAYPEHSLPAGYILNGSSWSSGQGKWTEHQPLTPVN